jgi:hydrogenase maturation factor
MNLVTGKIVDTIGDGPLRTAKIRVRGVFLWVPLMLLPEARTGDRILVERGVPIAIVREA